MANLLFKGLLFMNLTKRLIHVNVRRHGARLTVTVWGRMPLPRERRRSGGRFIEVGNDVLNISANEFREPIIVEDTDHPPCEILYEGFLKDRRDIDCFARYNPLAGVITFALASNKKPVPAFS